MVTVSIADYIIYTPLLIIDNNWAKYLHNRKNIRIFALRKVRNDINVIAIAWTISQEE